MGNLLSHLIERERERISGEKTLTQRGDVKEEKGANPLNERRTCSVGFKKRKKGE